MKEWDHDPLRVAINIQIMDTSDLDKLKTVPGSQRLTRQRGCSEGRMAQARPGIDHFAKLIPELSD